MPYFGDGRNGSYWAYEQELTTEKNIELDKEKQIIFDFKSALMQTIQTKNFTYLLTFRSCTPNILLARPSYAVRLIRNYINWKFRSSERYYDVLILHCPEKDQNVFCNIYHRTQAILMKFGTPFPG